MRYVSLQPTTPRPAALLITLLILVGMAAAPTAGAAPPAAPTAVVTMGDSYISGEAGRWQGNSINPAPGNDGTDRACVPSGPGCRVDKSRVYVGGTDVNKCLAPTWPRSSALSCRCRRASTSRARAR